MHLSKSYQLTSIDGRAFSDFKTTLKELHLKDTLVKLMESLERDGLEPPYTAEVLANVSQTRDRVWLEGLDLNFLNIDSTVNNEQFSFKVNFL